MMWVGITFLVCTAMFLYATRAERSEPEKIEFSQTRWQNGPPAIRRV